jgi:hypothetical protein
MPAPEPGLRIDRIAFRCSECGRVWRTNDDPQEWAFGHDCEV